MYAAVRSIFQVLMHMYNLDTALPFKGVHHSACQSSILHLLPGDPPAQAAILNGEQGQGLTP